MSVHKLAGKVAPYSYLINVPRLISAYYTHQPDPAEPAQRVAFGTSGHRGSSLEQQLQRRRISWRSARRSVELPHSRRASPARCTWAWIPTPCPSRPCIPPSRCSPPTAWRSSSSRVWATPLPRSSRMPSWPITAGRTTGLADGVVITPSHNPPEDGGYQVQPAIRRPGRHRHHQDGSRTAPTQIMADGLKDVKRMPFEKALKAATTHLHRLRAPLRGGSGERGQHGGHRRGRLEDRRRPDGRRGRGLLGADRRDLRAESGSGQPARSTQPSPS